jgi:hypothetical protein
MRHDIWHRSHRNYTDPYNSFADYVKRSPYRSVVTDSKFVRAMKEDSSITLLHLTTSLDKLLESGEIMASGGCMVGSFYCAMTHPINGAYRPHNLGSYIYEHEVRRTLESKCLTNKVMSPLLIELQLPAQRAVRGVSYLDLGFVHLKVLGALNASPTLKAEALQATLNMMSFMHKYLMDNGITDSDFYENLVYATSKFPMLGYIYFEAITEYIMLFSQDEQSIKMASRGEVNCWAYKDFVFHIQPHLLGRFDLGTFQPPLPQIRQAISELTEKKLLVVDAEDLVKTVRKRIVSLIRTCLLSDSDGHILHPGASFEDVAMAVPHMLGHAVDRAMRNPYYGDFHYAFDQLKAEQVWRYWNDNNILLPFNGIMPKGEIGINPASKKYKYRVYLAKPKRYNGELYFEKGDEIKLNIVPKMIHPRHALMGITSTKNSTQGGEQ